MFVFGLVHDIHRGLVISRFANRDRSRTESQQVSSSCFRFRNRDRGRTESQRVLSSCTRSNAISADAITGSANATACRAQALTGDRHATRHQCLEWFNMRPGGRHGMCRPMCIQAVMNSVAKLFGVEGRASRLASSARNVLMAPLTTQTIKSLLHMLRADGGPPRLQDGIT